MITIRKLLGLQLFVISSISLWEHSRDYILKSGPIDYVLAILTSSLVVFALVLILGRQL